MIRPIFISVEGVDGSGKTSAIPVIVDEFRTRGIELVSTRDPGGSPGGEAIRSIIKSRELDVERSTHLLLQMASRNELIHKTILPNLQAGRSVISDRFTDSTLVYQGDIDGFHKEVNAIWDSSAFKSHRVQPDYTFFMNVSAAMYSSRISARGLDNLEAIWEKQPVRPDEAYRALLKDDPHQQRTRSIIQIDADQPLEQVADQLKRAVHEIILNEQNTGYLGSLVAK